MPRQTTSTFFAAASAFLIASHAGAQVQPTHNDLVYATVGTQEMTLDLYIPNGGTPPPFACVINIHGGGWAGGTNFPIPSPLAVLLQQHKLAVASVKYRLTSQAGQYGPGVPVIFPAQIHDVKGAVRWLRANAATYQLDPERFGVFGSSAGGHLSALLATSGDDPELEGDVGGNLSFSSRVQACVDYFGPTDIININLDVTTPPGSTIDHDAPQSPESHLVGWDDPGQGIGDIRDNLRNPSPPYPALVHLCNLVNPVTFVSADDPPIQIAHGTADTVVPLHQSQRLADALSAINHPTLFLQVKGAGHGPLGVPTDAATVNFLRTVLRRVGDLNVDGVVNPADLSQLLGQWGQCQPPPNPCFGDLNGDGVVDSADLAQLLAHWG